MIYRDQLTRYRPYNEQEDRDREHMLALLDCKDVFSRENPVFHMTASAWVVDEAGERVVMAYHHVYQSWAWLGGHADGETDLLQVAMREVREESGLSRVEPVTEDLFSLEILTVDGHEKRGHYVSSHLHLNATYLLRAQAGQVLRNKPDENAMVAWFTPQEALRASSEDWIRERVYRKLNEKMQRYL